MSPRSRAAFGTAGLASLSSAADLARNHRSIAVFDRSIPVGDAKRAGRAGRPQRDSELGSVLAGGPSAANPICPGMLSSMSRWLRTFLAASATSWFGLGLWGFIAPESLISVVGVAVESRSGVVELRAMYGGLPMAVGALAAAGLFRPSLRRSALLTLAYLSAGLFMARLVGAAMVLEVTSFTATALLFEILSTVFAVRLLALLEKSAPS